MSRIHFVCAAFCFVALLTGCRDRAAQDCSLTLATTTSTRDSGLLDILLPRFESETGITVKMIAVGSGQAIEMGRRGDADVLLTHAPQAEKQFMDEGHGCLRYPVMYNDFVLVGPASNPAGVEHEKPITEALRRIAETQSRFVSRGDESGTHMKERSLWQEAGLAPEGDWYIEVGAGMAQTLRVASEKRAYTLSDRGTFLAQREGLQLAILVEGDESLRNPYSVIVVDARKHPGVHEQAARRFAEFLTSPQTQRIIAEFGIDRFGQPLFFPLHARER
ncbi:substrate-binding domain-containing protein [Thermostilla marina]